MNFYIYNSSKTLFEFFVEYLLNLLSEISLFIFILQGINNL